MDCSREGNHYSGSEMPRLGQHQLSVWEEAMGFGGILEAELLH